MSGSWWSEPAAEFSAVPARPGPPRLRLGRNCAAPAVEMGLARAVDELLADARTLVERKLRRHGEDCAAAALPVARPYNLDQILGDWLPNGAA
jgi:hypothetical protein